MAERYNATEISRMSKMILKTVDDMERNLEEIIKNLNLYRSCLNDQISKEADVLVKNIRNRIDTIRIEFEERSRNADEAARVIDALESGGLER